MIDHKNAANYEAETIKLAELFDIAMTDVDLWRESARPPDLQYLFRITGAAELCINTDYSWALPYMELRGHINRKFSRPHLEAISLSVCIGQKRFVLELNSDSYYTLCLEYRDRETGKVLAAAITRNMFKIKKPSPTGKSKDLRKWMLSRPLSDETEVARVSGVCHSLPDHENIFER